jgi:hypothetical protein
LHALLAKPNYPLGLVLVAVGALLVAKLSPLATHIEISFSVQWDFYTSYFSITVVHPSRLFSITLFANGFCIHEHIHDFDWLSQYSLLRGNWCSLS